jgi:hypothetical protein
MNTKLLCALACATLLASCGDKAPESASAPAKNVADLQRNESGGGCLAAGCFTMDAQQLSQFTQVGVLSDGKLITTNKAGFLFFGPYRILQAGKYEIEMDIKAKKLKEAYIDVASDKGNKINTNVPVSMESIKDGKIKLSFQLNNTENDIEVRLWVGDGDDLSVVAYKINLITN